MGNPFIFAAARSFLTAGSYVPPSPQARIAAGLRHLELLAADLGERSACLEMRKHFCAYTKGCFGGPGIPGGAALRDKLVRAQTIAEYRAALQQVERGTESTRHGQRALTGLDMLCSLFTP
jgi:tRNA-dihydrouridine synthase